MQINSCDPSGGCCTSVVPMKSKRKQSVNHGKVFEQAIEARLISARQEGIVADWNHTQPKTSKFKGLFVPTEAAGADFLFVLRGGLGCAMEAKSSTGHRCAADRIEPRQWAQLENYHRTGAISLLALEFREDDQVYQFVIPWGEVTWRTKNGSPTSVDMDAVKAWPIDERPSFIHRFVKQCQHCRRALHLRAQACICGTRCTK